MTDNELIRSVAARPECAGMTPAQIAAYINEPRQVRVEWRILSEQEVLDALTTSAAAVAAATDLYALAVAEGRLADQARFAPGAAFRLAYTEGDGFNAEPGTGDRLKLDAAVTAGTVTGAEAAAIVAKAQTPILRSIARTPVAEGGFGWYHDVEDADTVRRALEAT